MKEISKLLLFTIIAICLAPAKFVQAEQSVTASLIRHGKKMHDSQYYEIAVSDFSHALLLEPNNNEVIDLLLQIARKSSVEAELRIHLFHFEDLIKNIFELQGKIAYYARENVNFAKKLGEIDKFDDQLMSLIRNVGFTSNIANSEASRHLVKSNDALSHPLKKLNIFLEERNQYLSDELSSLRNQNDVLREQFKLSKGRLSDFKNKQTSRWSYSHSYHSSGKSDFSESHSGLIKQANNKKLTQQSKENLLKLFMENEQVDASKDYSETELSASNDETAKRLNNQILELENRVELGSKMLSDKDKEIELLQASVIRFEQEVKLYRQELNDEITSNKRGMLETNELLRLTTEKLEEAYSTIDVINEKYNQLSLKLDSIEKDVNDEDKRFTINTAMKNITNVFSIKGIKNTLFGKNEEGEGQGVSPYDVDNILVAKDEKLIELNGILQIYKAELKDASIALSQNADQLRVLKDENFNKDAIIHQAEVDIRELKDRLSYVESELKKYKYEDYYSKNNAEIMGVVGDLEEKLTKVNHYLRQQLSLADGLGLGQYSSH